MDEHITKWLNAYYDGELSRRRAAQVEAHLDRCDQCQADLEALADLSDLLHDDPGPYGLTAPEQFVTQVELRLPREQVEARWSGRALRAGWMIVPAVLAGLWILAQTVIVVDQFVVTLGVRELQLFASPFNCLDFALNRQTAIQIAMCSMGLISRQIWVWAIGLLYVSWLAIWWANRARQSREVTV